jgi:hypothetical protein
VVISLQVDNREVLGNIPFHIIPSFEIAIEYLLAKFAPVATHLCILFK